MVQYLARFQNDTIYDEDHDANTPLHLACLNGHVAVARILIKANCGIETRLGSDHNNNIILCKKITSNTYYLPSNVLL